MMDKVSLRKFPSIFIFRMEMEV